MSGRKKRETLASTLDRTQWDYSPSKDRSFLLTSVERMFASVSWEIAPQHLTPIADAGSTTPQRRPVAKFETRPLTPIPSKT